MLDFFGRFHPVLVHLPIGFLLLAVLFQWMGKIASMAYLRLSVPVILVLGMLSGLFACVTGLALSGTAEYPESTLGWHQWMGILTTLLSLGMFWAVQRKLPLYINGFGALILAGITITGHLGGTLTHGENYLFGKADARPALPPIADIQSAHAYNDLVQPIFEARCVSCHGATKQKGKLRLDDAVSILKGGEEGPAIKPGDPDGSELIQRLLLPEKAKKHMPPAGEAQLLPHEIQLLQWWVRSGADFKQPVNALQQTSTDKQMLAFVQSASQGLAGDSLGLFHTAGTAPVFPLTASIPEKEVKPADPALVQRLKAAGIVLLPVSRESNYLSANFVTAGDKLEDSTLQLLQGIREQLIWLKIDEMQVSDTGFPLLAQLTGLTRLQLSRTNLSDKTLPSLLNLKNLQWLNLVGSPVTAASLVQLEKLPNLKQLFLYQANISTADWNALQKALSNVQIDTGNYRLPLLPGDTSIVK